MNIPRQTKTLTAVWITLLVLLAISATTAYFSLGIGNLLANFLIAAIKVALIAFVFMHLSTSGTVIRIAAASALLFLFLLSFLSFSDFLTRPKDPAHWHAPVGPLNRDEIERTFAPDGA